MTVTTIHLSEMIITSRVCLVSFGKLLWIISFCRDLSIEEVSEKYVQRFQWKSYQSIEIPSLNILLATQQFFYLLYFQRVMLVYLVDDLISDQSLSFPNSFKWNDYYYDPPGQNDNNISRLSSFIWQITLNIFIL